MKRLILGFVLISILMTACQVCAIDLIAGKEYFLRTPLYAPKDKDSQIDWINYSDVAEKLRAGENVSIIEINGDTIKFMLNKKVFSFMFTQKRLAGTPGVYDKYFTSVDIREEIAKFDDRIVKDIALGMVAPGMTKEQVLLSAGCPAVAGGSKTYDRTLQDVMFADNWIYYRSRLKKMFVKFSGGKVSSVEE